MTGVAVSGSGEDSAGCFNATMRMSVERDYLRAEDSASVWYCCGWSIRSLFLDEDVRESALLGDVASIR